MTTASQPALIRAVAPPDAIAESLPALIRAVDAPDAIAEQLPVLIRAEDGPLVVAESVPALIRGEYQANTAESLPTLIRASEPPATDPNEPGNLVYTRNGSALNYSTTAAEPGDVQHQLRTLIRAVEPLHAVTALPALIRGQSELGYFGYSQPARIRALKGSSLRCLIRPVNPFTRQARNARRPLSDLLPLRNSSVYGSALGGKTLPIVYGRATVKAVPYDTEGRLYVVADHPVQGVDRVVVGEKTTDTYKLINRADRTGKAVALIELGNRAINADVQVLLRGKMNATTGNLIANPADILRDILNSMAGRSVSLSDVSQLRAATSGIQAGRVVNNSGQSIRGLIAELMESIGALWASDDIANARLYP